LADFIFGEVEKKWGVGLSGWGKLLAPAGRLDPSAGVRGHRQNLGRSFARVLARPQAVRHCIWWKVSYTLPRHFKMGL
jgi:hypothetical protein